MSAAEDPLSNGHVNGASSDREPSPDMGEDRGGLGDDDDADLFGDEDDQPQGETEPLQRKLDDSELDSGDDDGRDDRIEATVEEDDEEMGERPAQLLSADVARVNFPEGDELYMLNMPDFLAIKHRNFDYDTYEPPTQPHDGDPERKFSPFSAAMTSMFWCRDPKNPDLLQSSARIIKWSDGSQTLQLATKPTEQYRIEPKAVRQSFAYKQKKLAQPSHYDPSKDSHVFLAASHATAGVDLQIIRPIDATMKILPSGDYIDESILRLKQSLAAAKDTHDPLARLKTIEVDPELAKKTAEAFEKEKARTMRKREAAEDRLLQRRDRVLNRSTGGGGYGRSAGLSIAGLEADDDGMPSTRSKMIKRRKTTNRNGDIYSDDEDPTMPRHRTREDEYDREDDFLADSDEEPEMFDEDGEEDVLEDDDEDDAELEDDLVVTNVEKNRSANNNNNSGKSTREKEKEKKVQDKSTTSGNKDRRSRMDEIEGDEDEDAEGEEDTEFLKSAAADGLGGAGVGGGRKRRVIDDEDEDE